jgi:hypothetical protein
VPKRSSLRDRLGQARGQEAVYGQPKPTPNTLPASMSVDRPPWEERHQRVTFYCPLELLEAVEADMRQSGRSKSAVIVDALRDHLNWP